jgi:hypothetical protein
MGILVGLHQTTDARPRNAVLLRDLRRRHPGAAVEDDLLPVHVQPRPPDLAALQLRPAHARPHALDDDATLQLRHRGHDDDDGPAQRALGVDRLALRKELDAEPRKRP